jgi:hypothetical protein
MGVSAVKHKLVGYRNALEVALQTYVKYLQTIANQIRSLILTQSPPLEVRHPAIEP